MLEVFVSIFCMFMMTIVGCYIIKKILNEKVNIFLLKNFMAICASVIMPLILYDSNYQGVYTMIIYIVNIIIYKIIFNKTISKTTILTSIVMILSFLGDLISATILRTFFSVDLVRGLWYIMAISNIIVYAFCIIMINIKRVTSFFYNITNNLSNKKFTKMIIFVVLLIFFFTIISNNIYTNAGWNTSFLLDILIISIFMVLFIIYMKERNDYNNLIVQYDELFEYVQSFEELIEKEQLNRHEYKNQLAVLRCLTKEKKVKDKIDEILDDSINIEGDVVRKLSSLPKGGIKGLMYYKAAVAQKNKIKLDVTISLNSKSLLSKLSEKQIRVICKLIGIYFDNAIEASKETRKKNVLVEVYELKDNVTFVFSNTFKKHKNFDKRNEKGVSSKGEGHGNGLYFAKKLLDKNDWLESKQEIIDNYYIQQLIIKKENTSKK